VELTQEVDNGAVRLVIADNGVGFDQDRLGQPEGRRRWGLMTMSERAAAAGGHCYVESQPGQGTRVVVEVSR
jgi:signal transduction histidine kinase